MHTHAYSDTSEDNSPTTPSTPPNQLHTLSAIHLSQHNLRHSKPRSPLEWIVVRIEVTDTGCGIRPKDMAQSKLFCEYPVRSINDAVTDYDFCDIAPFNQTELGRQQGMYRSSLIICFCS